jgi:hypothetical protein
MRIVHGKILLLLHFYVSEESNALKFITRCRQKAGNRPCQLRKMQFAQGGCQIFVATQSTANM